MAVSRGWKRSEVIDVVVERRLDRANSINGGYVNRHLTDASPETELIQGKETPRLCSAPEGQSADIGRVGLVASHRECSLSREERLIEDEDSASHLHLLP